MKLSPNWSLYALCRSIVSPFIAAHSTVEYALVLYVDQPLRMCIPEVTLVGEAEVDLGLVERIGDLVGEDTRRETGDDLLDPSVVCRMKDVIVDEDVVPEERELRRVAESKDGCIWTSIGVDRGAPCISCS